MGEIISHIVQFLLSAAFGVIGMVYEPAPEAEIEARDAVERTQETLESAQAAAGRAYAGVVLTGR